MLDKKLCRLCTDKLTPSDDPSSSENSTSEISVEAKILYCFRFEIKENDQDLPNRICLLCKEKLNLTYDFMHSVEKAQDFFNDELKRIKQSNARKSKTVVSKIESKDEHDKKDQADEVASKDVKKIDLDTKLDEEKMKVKQERKRNFRVFLEEWKRYKWKCQECSIECSDVKEFRAHYAEIHNKPPVYTCNECNKTIIKYNVFLQHVRIHRNRQKYCCEFCGKFSYDKDRHNRHLTSHSDEKHFICSICGQALKTKGSLRIHEKYHMPNELRKQFECDICNKKLSSYTGLYSHKKLHTGVKDFSCKVCGKVFALKTNLTQHEVIHLENKAFKCEKCPRSFKTARRLKRHEMIHLNLKPYPCDDCDKAFRTRAALNDHKVVHSDIFPYECQFCEKKFKLKQLLKMHIRQHTGEKPYECVGCKHKFTNWSNYNKHMKCRHGVNMASLTTQLINAQCDYKKIIVNRMEHKDDEQSAEEVNAPCEYRKIIVKRVEDVEEEPSSEGVDASGNMSVKI